MGTAFAILSGKGPGVALALAIPISILAEMVLSGLFVFRAVFQKRFLRYASEGDYRKLQRLHVLSGLLKPVLMGLITLLALLLGAPAMKSLLESLPSWMNTGLQVAGNLLPALGFALLMNLLFQKKVAPYFFLGFLLAAYLKLPVIAIGGLGLIIALLINDMGEGVAAEAEGELGREEAAGEGETVLPARIIRSVFFRSLALEANFNFETWQNTGFAFAILPVLKKLYPTKERMARALKRHLQFFNTSPYGSTFILGIIAAMEERSSRDDDFDEESIQSVKMGLMGPLAGVFDSLFWGTLRVIAAGVGTSLALKGNVLGPVLFLLLFNLPHLALRYRLTFTGYRAGTRFLQRLANTHAMEKLTSGAAIVGLMVVGAMPATLMNVRTGLVIGAAGADGGGGIAVQGILDQLVPALLPLVLTLTVYYFIKINVRTSYLLAGLLIAGFVGSIIHVFV